MKRGCAIISGTFLGVFSDFWVSFFVTFDFFRNNPEFCILILIFN